MQALICKKCLDIPFIEYKPGLSIDFICCDKTTVNHTELNKKLHEQFILKCSKCQIFTKCHYLYDYLLCDDCMKRIKIKSVNQQNLVNNEL